MIKLSELFAPSALTQMLDDGYVRTQAHPTLPLLIFNYTEKAAHEGVWNDVTLTCRGLIVNTITEEVVARPFRKFFNYGQAGAPELDLDARVTVTDKMDGSLGIIYPTPDGYAVATRGSFASEQAIHATRVLNMRYPSWQPLPWITALVEIIYPQNRIVVDYGQVDDLVLLGTVDIESGRSFSPDRILDWPGPRTTIFLHRTLSEALAATPRPNAEGLVVHFPDVDERIKLKQVDYVALHRIVTGLNARTVWQHLVDGKPLDDLIEPLPDEFAEWVRTTAEDITFGVTGEVMRLTFAYQNLVATMPDGWDGIASREGRKTFAMAAACRPDKWAMFALLDGNPIGPEVLKRAKPEPYVTPAGRTYGEDTA